MFVFVNNTTTPGREINGGGKLPLMESFYSIQGEGYHQGRAAWFIRLAGCDVGCVWCDVKESWEANAYPLRDILDITRPAVQSLGEFVVVTGGEPLLYDMDLLTKRIRAEDKAVHLETSGTHPLTGNWDWICLSPKKFKQPLPDIYKKANELKVVVYNNSDLAWADKQARLTASECRLYLQPEWSNRAKVMPLIVEHIKNNPQWSVSLQIHKYMEIR